MGSRPQIVFCVSFSGGRRTYLCAGEVGFPFCQAGRWAAEDVHCFVVHVLDGFPDWDSSS